jgi:hypothetical protein
MATVVLPMREGIFEECEPETDWRDGAGLTAGLSESGIQPPAIEGLLPNMRQHQRWTAKGEMSGGNFKPETTARRSQRLGERSRSPNHRKFRK